MSATIERRLASLEARQGATRGRVMLLLPWEIMPEEQEGDMIGCYQFVVATPDGPQRVEYQRTGIHPEQDRPGSWNRHLYYGEPYHA